MQGTLTSLMSLTTIIGPLIMNSTFAYFTTDKAPFHFPGVHFLIGAVCMLLGLIITYKVLNREKKERPELLEVINSSEGLSSSAMHQ